MEIECFKDVDVFQKKKFIGHFDEIHIHRLELAWPLPVYVVHELDICIRGYTYKKKKNILKLSSTLAPNLNNNAQI